jgi:hypothetical protein
MGEIAEAMIEGDLCVSCGSVLECEGFGIPIMCHYCHSDRAKKCSEPVDGALCENYYGDAE